MERQLRWVVDTSVVVKWYLPENYSEKAEVLLDQGSRLFAPDFVWAELGNVLVTNSRAGRIDEERAKAILRAFARVPIELRAVADLAETALIAARETGRSFYDCVYLALAIQTGSHLVTADLRFYNVIKNTPWGRHCLWIENVA
jgi:predicted nucleic acid-binding protein